jgi:hypothetical protein
MCLLIGAPRTYFRAESIQTWSDQRHEEYRAVKNKKQGDEWERKRIGSNKQSEKQ